MGVTFPHAPDEARALLDAIGGVDPDLARIEMMAGPLPWRRRPTGFPGLLQAIVAQRISNQAASAIWRRLQAVPGALDPVFVPALSDEALLGAGLSRPKVLHARALAAAFRSGVLDAETLALMNDEAAIAAIASVRGMGRWSAEVYLLFALGRPDVFPSGDLALAGAVAHLKGLARVPDRRRCGSWPRHGVRIAGSRPGYCFITGGMSRGDRRWMRRR